MSPGPRRGTSYKARETKRKEFKTKTGRYGINSILELFRWEVKEGLLQPASVGSAAGPTQGAILPADIMT
ncbi:hypothetical protein RRG08_038403 [Elysia crispata]|uniref:Uncharacterized protein n=1 Tax=Elysia crispata TaxID=231223 RepID=A0AAE1DTR6_9GAST|nr:hypothetical protein RRG08_038403 [Elysia crispata]